MKNSNSFKKLTRTEMKNVTGGEKSPAECINGCYASASSMCAGAGGGLDGQACFQAYFEDCELACGGVSA